MKSCMRDYLESSILRHGDIKDLSAVIEKGEKPAYKAFIDFMEGKTDPDIDIETTEKIIRKKIEEKQLGEEVYDVIISSPAKRAQATAGTVNTVLQTDKPIRISEYLREVKLPMDTISQEFYESAKNISEVRQKALEAFLAGDKLDEDALSTYRRAERFLIYLRRIRKQTMKKPLFITHGIFLRFLDLAMRHEGVNLPDDEAKAVIEREFKETKRRGTFEGMRIESNNEGIKSVGII